MDKKITPHLKILIHLSKVDGHADDSELKVIRQVGSSQNVSDQDIEWAIDKAESSEAVPSVNKFTRDQKIDLVFDLLAVMKADGIIHKNEMSFCLDLIDKMRFDEAVIYDLVGEFPEDYSDSNQALSIKKKIGNYLKP